MGVSRRAAAAFAVAALMMASPTTVPAAERATDDVPPLAQAIQRLTDHGVARAAIVIQRGARNYAGPNCPGDGWTCSKHSVVVQHSSVAALNIAECSPDGTAGENSCSIVQVSNGGSNVARCEITDTELQSFSSCSIDQTNTSGDNTAETVQTITQEASGIAVTEGAEVQSSVSQANQTGANSSTIKQTVTQSLALEGPFFADHLQDARFCASMHQTSTSGGNSSDIDQTHTATSDVLNVLSAEQRQQSSVLAQQPCADGGLTEPTDYPNIHAVATQFSDTGAITQTVDQNQTLDQTVTSAVGPTTQLQGPEAAFSGGGLAVEIDGDTQHATATHATTIKKAWGQDAISVEAISQTQNDREVLSGIGLARGQRSYKDCTWLLDTALTASQLTLFASDPAQTSSQLATSHCTDTQDGTISSNLNGDQQSQQFDDEFVNEEVNRGPGAPEGGPAAFPHLHAAVVNDTQSQAFGGDEEPSSTDAFPSEQIRYRMTAHNHGDATTTATGGVISDVVPGHMTFDAGASSEACSAAASGQAGDTITCSVGPIAGGDAASVFIVFDLASSGYDGDEAIANQATLTTDGSPAVPSNTVEVVVATPPAVLELHKAVVNETTGGSFAGPETPSAVSALPGNFIRYRLRAHNHGHPASVASGFTMSEVVPDNMTAFSCTSPCFITGLGGPGETVYWILPDITGGGVEVRDVVFKLDPDVSDYTALPRDITNIAFLSPPDGEPIASNSTTVSVQMPAPNSGLEKKVRDGDCGSCDFVAETTIGAGGVAEYRLRYTNSGTGAATNVVIHDEVPLQSEFGGCALLPTECTTSIGGLPPFVGDPPGTALYWEIGTVPAGATVDVFFTVNIDPDCDGGWTGVGDAVDNVADVDTTEEALVTSGLAKVNVTVSCVLD